MHGVDDDIGIAAGEVEAVVLNVVVVSDQVDVDIFSIFTVLGVVNDGVVVELLNGLSVGLIGECLE